MAQNKSRRLLWAVCLAALAAFAAAMVWLHYQQLCSPGGGSDPYTSDLGMHLAFAQRGMVYSTVSLLIGPAYALAGRVGIAVLLAAFHLAAVAVFACGLRTALPDAPRPARLLVSLVVNLATAVWMPPRRLLVPGHCRRHDLSQHNVYYARALCTAGDAGLLPCLADDAR